MFDNVLYEKCFESALQNLLIFRECVKLYVLL